MRQARIKVPTDEGPGVYHAMTRTVNGERLFDDVAKEVLRKQLRQVADYTGVEVITYAILSNHFHVLLRVPQKTELPDIEMLRRYQVLYPRPTRYQVQRLEVIQAQLATNGPEAVAWRRRQLALMGDLSQFMKLLKQRFSIWFNRSHRRYGTLWAERFKSLLLEPTDRVVETVAAYLDLNAVRIGLARDPKDYRFCGYAEAIAGSEVARAGIRSIHSTTNEPWAETHASYRQRLFGTGADPREHGRSITTEDFARVVREGGHLPLAAVLRCRIRYFTDGAVLGGKAFVETQLAKQRRADSHPLPDVTDWGGLATLRQLRRRAFG